MIDEAMLIFDEPTLPLNALIDTGVFFRFLGDKPDEEKSAYCRAFCKAMLNAGRELFVAAPTLAEVSRYRGVRVPRTRGITVVPFDEKAAEILGLQMTQAKLHEARDASGLSLTYFKYDAMIVACALRVSTRIVVALDSDHGKIVGALPGGFSVQVVGPEHFAQRGLFLMMRSASPNSADGPGPVKADDGAAESSPASAVDPSGPLPDAEVIEHGAKAVPPQDAEG